MSTPSSLSLLRQLGLLRWRILLNGIMRSGRRDFLERLSRASESALPLAILLLAIPAAIALAGLGVASGWFLAGDPSAARPLLQFVRFVLFAVTMLALFAPVILSASQQTSGIVRLLLLPIPRRVLYLAQALGALADPWILLALPLMFGIAIGLAARAQLAGAAVAVIATAAMMIVLLGLSALATVCLQLLVRNRRRAEALTLFGTLLLVAASLIPTALAREHDDKRHGGSGFPQWMLTASTAVPSELFSRAVQDAAARNVTGSSGALLALLAWGAFAHGLTWPLYGRLVEVPTSTGGPRRYAGSRSPARSIPLLGRRASAVATNFVRLAYRTPRGRSIVLMPIIMMAVFAVLFTIRGQTIPVGPFRIGGGFTLALFGAVIALLSLAPLLLNQFAVDGAGLTLTFLVPVSDREVLHGKAAGGFVIALGPMMIGAVAGMLTGAHSLWLWIAVAFGVLAVYAIYAPVAALIAMILPRSVDLAAIGNASNAHQGAALLGMLAFAAATAPPALLAFLSQRVWGGERTAPLAIGAWLVVAACIAFALFRIAERVLRARRENLAMVAQGR